MVTTDLHHSCTTSHTGTSASAPLAAGICALVLEANKNLTWRDLQHIVVRAARRDNLHAEDWASNGVGKQVSHHFGYGLMDAGAMVRLAKRWSSVPPQKLCEIVSDRADKQIPAKSHVELSMFVLCEHVRFLEHVQAKVTLTASRRGDIHIYLTSPAGTRSTLLAQRPIDGSRAGFQSWPFMTVHSWGENPDGTWKLEVHNEGRFYGRASLKEWSMHLYGTTTDPGSPRSKKSPTAGDEPASVHTTNRPNAATSTTEVSVTSGKSTGKDSSLLNVKTRQNAEEKTLKSSSVRSISGDRSILFKDKTRKIATEDGILTSLSARSILEDRSVVQVKTRQIAEDGNLTTVYVNSNFEDRLMVKSKTCQITRKENLTALPVWSILKDKVILKVTTHQTAAEESLISPFVKTIMEDRSLAKVKTYPIVGEESFTIPHVRSISGNRAMIKTQTHRTTENESWRTSPVKSFF